jgi:anti-sigma regulatory factor (Ser/Thr protein kinase)
MNLATPRPLEDAVPPATGFDPLANGYSVVMITMSRRDSHRPLPRSRDSSTPGPLLSIELPAEPESIPRARHAVAEVAARAGVDASDVALAVSEAVTNAITHGYREEMTGTVRVTAADDGGRLRIDVVDHGVGISPDPTTRGLGMGLAIIGAVSTGVQLERAAPGLRLRMLFDRVR